MALTAPSAAPGGATATCCGWRSMFLEGRLRLFFEDTEGTRTTELLTAGDFAYVPAGTPPDRDG